MDSTAPPSGSTEFSISEVLRRADWLRRLVRGLTSDADEAEDVVQETLIAVASRPPLADRPIDPWLARVSRNLFLNRARSGRRRRERDQVASELVAAEVAGADQVLERLELRRLLVQRVSALEEPGRRIVFLRYFEGRSSAEIADELGIPAGTVRWRLKQALERLRTDLDARLGGRATWMLVLGRLSSSEPAPALRSGDERPGGHAPGAAARSGTRRSVGLAVLGSIGMATIVGIFFPVVARGWRPANAGIPQRGSSLGEGRPAPPTGDPAGPDPPGSRGGLASVAAGWLGTCQDELARLRERIAATETERVELTPAADLFPTSAPNPLAEAELGPLIDRLLREESPGEPPLHTLECHGRACRLVLVMSDAGKDLADMNATDLWLDADQDLSSRSKLTILLGREPLKDPLSGRGLMQQEIYLKLKNLSGKPASSPSAVAASPMALSAAPVDPASCQAQRRALEAELSAKLESNVELRPLGVKFRTAVPNGSLTREIDDLVRGIFRDNPAGVPRTDCRGTICLVRFPWPTPAMTDADRLYGDAHLGARVLESSFTAPNGYYLAVSKDPRANGQELLESRWRQLMRSPALIGCERQHRPRGKLTIELQLPASDARDDAGENRKISTRYGDELADTALARCVEGAISETILAEPLPSRVSAGQTAHTLRFPR